MRQHLKTLLTGLLTLSLVGGCIAIEGSDRYEARNPTLGKQLHDLKTAHDSGAISDAEYQQTKARLLSDAK